MIESHIERLRGMAINLHEGMVNQVDEANDLLQELYIKMHFKKADGYFEGKKDNEIGGIINRSLRNLFIDKIRAKKAADKKFLYLDDCSDWWIDQEGLFNIASADNLVWYNLLLEDINKYFYGLPEEVRSCFSLIVLDEYTQVKVSRLLNIKIPDVVRNMWEVKIQIKQHLAA